MRKLRVAIPIPDFICGIADSILQIYSSVRLGPRSRLIPLTQGKFAVVDADDYERLNRHKWYAVKYGPLWYALRKKTIAKARQANVWMHREVLNLENGKIVDHINGDGLDNRKDNLRPASQMQNCWNKKKSARKHSSRFKGVSRFKRLNNWQVKISCKGKSYFLGYFKDEEDAARAYDTKAAELFGPFARKNFP